MKKTFVVVILVAGCSLAGAQADEIVSGGAKKDATFVAGKSAGDSKGSVSGNWSARDDKSLISTQTEKKSLIHGSIGVVWSSAVSPSPYRFLGR